MMQSARGQQPGTLLLLGFSYIPMVEIPFSSAHSAAPHRCGQRHTIGFLTRKNLKEAIEAAVGGLSQIVAGHTLDGQNPAPPGMAKTL